MLRLDALSRKVRLMVRGICSGTRNVYIGIRIICKYDCVRNTEIGDKHAMCTCICRMHQNRIHCLTHHDECRTGQILRNSLFNLKKLH